MAKKEDIVYCIDVGDYETFLTLNRPYKVFERDEEKGQLRIKGDTGRLIWIPNYYLTATLHPEFDLWLESDLWHKDQEWDPKNDCMNIGVTLPDGRRFSLNVWTFNFFNRQVEEQRAKKGIENKRITPPDLFVEELSRELINEVISDMLRHDDNLDETLNDSIFSINFSDPWIDAYELEDLGKSLEMELKKELDTGHVLFKKAIDAIAKHQNNNEVLFSINNEELALVNLTWSGQKEKEGYPETIIYHNLKHFWKSKIKNLS